MWKEKVPLNINSKQGILSCKICPPVFGGYKNLLFYIEVSVILRDLTSRFDCSLTFVGQRFFLKLFFILDATV